MKKLIIGILIFLAGVFVGYVGDTLMEIREYMDNFGGVVVEKIVPGVQNKSTNTQESDSVSSSSSAAKEKMIPEVSAPIKIAPSALSDSQKALLSTLGIDPNAFVVTPEMVRCAEDSLGSARVAEIVAGSKPSAVELIKVAPCL